VVVVTLGVIDGVSEMVGVGLGSNSPQLPIKVTFTYEGTIRVPLQQHIS
jgi:hypothetical protein